MTCSSSLCLISALQNSGKSSSTLKWGGVPETAETIISEFLFRSSRKSESVTFAAFLPQSLIISLFFVDLLLLRFLQIQDLDCSTDSLLLCSSFPTVISELNLRFFTVWLAAYSKNLINTNILPQIFNNQLCLMMKTLVLFVFHWNCSNSSGLTPTKGF